jgi:hypothetical protein
MRLLGAFCPRKKPAGRINKPEARLAFLRKFLRESVFSCVFMVFEIVVYTGEQIMFRAGFRAQAAPRSGCAATCQGWKPVVVFL